MENISLQESKKLDSSKNSKFDAKKKQKQKQKQKILPQKLNTSPIFDFIIFFLFSKLHSILSNFFHHPILLYGILKKTTPTTTYIQQQKKSTIFSSKSISIYKYIQ